MTETPKAAVSKAPDPKMKPTVIEIIAQEEQQDKKLTRIAVGVAVVLHIFIFAFHWPTFAGGLKDATEKKTKIYVVKQVKFKQPPKQELQQIPKPKSKKVPIPDPTPDEPEPIRDDEPGSRNPGRSSAPRARRAGALRGGWEHHRTRKAQRTQSGLSGSSPSRSHSGSRGP